MSAVRSKKTTESAEPSKKKAKAGGEKSKTAATSRTRSVKDTAKTSGSAAEKEPKRSAAAKTADKKSEKAETKSRVSAARSAKKGEEKASKKSGTARAKSEQDKGGEFSSKTPQVMRLVEQRNDMVNPTIMAGKSSIPRKLRGLEPLTKIMKREAEAVFGTDEDAETFNLTALVIDDNAAPILRRFNACDCEICIEQLSRLTADSVPARFAKLKRRSVERKAPEVEELKAPLKRAVTSRMIRLVMQNKRRSFHDL